MAKRKLARHDAVLLLKDLTVVSVILPDKTEIESSVVDISSQGLKVSIPSSSFSFSIPRHDETVEVVFQVIRLRFTCRCIYSMYNQDGTVLLGLYVFDSKEQVKLRELIDTEK